MGESTDAVARLAQRYPQVGTAVLTDVLEQAGRTIVRMLGHPDPAAAEDLARLRLDIRMHCYA